MRSGESHYFSTHGCKDGSTACLAGSLGALVWKKAMAAREREGKEMVDVTE